MFRESGLIRAQKPSRVAVIGVGQVGATYAYTLLVEGAADEICLIDINKEKALGEAMDLNHAMPFARRADIWAGTMDDVKGADIVVIAAGAAQKPGESRMDLLSKNARIVGSIAEKAGRLAPEAIFLVVTNPVDVMSYVTLVRSGLEPQRVIGSGTVLDTARLRSILAKDLGVDPKSVHATVLGEHGDSEMTPWSRATVAGLGLLDWPGFTKECGQRIFSQVKRAAYDIIALKGATYYAISLALTRITQSVLNDLRTVYSVSVYLQGQHGIDGVYLGVPSVVGREGILRIIEQPLTRNELAELWESARLVKRAIDSLNLPRPRVSGRVLVKASGLEASEELVPRNDEKGSVGQEQGGKRRPSRIVPKDARRPRRIEGGQ